MKFVGSCGELISEVCGIFQLEAYPQCGSPYLICENSDIEICGFASGGSYRRALFGIYTKSAVPGEALAQLDGLAHTAQLYRGNGAVVCFTVSEQPYTFNSSESGGMMCGMKLWVYYMKGGDGS